MPPSRTISLAPFEGCAATKPFSCSVSLQLQGGLLQLCYSISGPLRRLIIPAEAPLPCFATDLWRSTCCECFLRQETMKNYTEWNFAPSGNWWTCIFDDYRAPARKQPSGLQPQHLKIQRRKNILTLTAAIVCPSQPALQIGPALILAHADGCLSHWAMQHPGGKPDFHLPGTCACSLETRPHNPI